MTVKQSTKTSLYVKEFKREIGQLLYLSRTEKGIELFQISENFEWDIRFLERMELGKVPFLYFWRAVRLMKFYGKVIYPCMREAEEFKKDVAFNEAD